MFKMWQVNGIEPEVYDYKTGKVLNARLPAAARDRRIDILSLSLHKRSEISRDGKGDVRRFRKILSDRCGICRPEKRRDKREDRITCTAFVFAETFKYFYLLFAPEKTLDFNKVVFNTEAIRSNGPGNSLNWERSDWIPAWNMK